MENQIRWQFTKICKWYQRSTFKTQIHIAEYCYDSYEDAIIEYSEMVKNYKSMSKDEWDTSYHIRVSKMVNNKVIKRMVSTNIKSINQSNSNY